MDVYRCPAGERLKYRYSNAEDGKELRRYWTTACPKCQLKAHCTTGQERRITRWEYEQVLEAAGTAGAAGIAARSRPENGAP